VRASPRGLKTVQKWTEKNERFILENFQTTYAFNILKKRKNVLMLVFFGPFTRFFGLFKMSKIQKNRKNVRKIAFFLML
jgi:hypothetical protein